VIAGRSTVVKLAANRRATSNVAKLTAAISKLSVAVSHTAVGSTPTAYASLAPTTGAGKIK